MKIKLVSDASRKKPMAHTATAKVIHEKIARLLFDPPPKLETFRDMLIRGGVPYTKSNPDAKRGGGPQYFHVAAAERFLRRKAGLA